MGTLMVLIHGLWPPFSSGPRQAVGVYLLVAALIVIPLTLAVLMRPALRRMLAAGDVLVPLGVLTLALALCGWLASIPIIWSVASRSHELNLFNNDVSISLVFVLAIILHVAYAAWTTTLILNSVRRGNSNPLEALKGVRRWFWRVLGLESICISVLLLGVSVAISMGTIAWFFVILLALVLNVATVALLPVALDEELRFFEALSAGIRQSLVGWKEWAIPVLAQLILLGAVTYVSVSYSTGAGQYHITKGLGINGFWIGGYENDCRWYGAFTDALKVSKIGVVNTALSLVFGVLAIAVKFCVVQGLENTSSPDAAPRVQFDN